MAFLVIVIGTLVIILLDPPHSVCDDQIDVFKEQVGKIFFIPPKKKAVIKNSRYAKDFEYCRQGNSPGSCFEMFNGLRLLQRELSATSKECAQAIGGIKEIKKAFWDGMTLISRMAWGEQPPETLVDKVGWLNQSDIALFCSLKSQGQRVYGKRWEKFRERQFTELPGASDMPREEAWSRMLLAINCRRYQ